MGGSDDCSNLILLTVEEHAEAHRILYEEYGHWQDYYAWKGLEGIVPKKELISEMNRAKVKESHKNGKYDYEKMRLSRIGFKQPQSQKDKVSKFFSKKWLISDPKNNIFIIENLNSFCKEMGLDQGNMVKVSQGKLKQHKGYLCEKLS